LIHIIDGLSDEPFADYSQINTELALFDSALAEKPQIIVYNKIDLPEVLEKWPTVKKTFTKHHLAIMEASAISHHNLLNIVRQANDLLRTLPVLEPRPSEPVYHPASKVPEFEIIRLPQGWQIKGQSIERAAAMTYWEYEDAIRRFQRVLESMGIDQALRDMGIMDGDTVIIGNHEFTWKD